MNRRLFIVLFLILFLLLVVFLVAQRFNLFNNLPLPLGLNSDGISSCGFLEEKYCRDGKVVKVNIYGNNIDAVAYKLPEGTTISIPFNGNIVSAEFTQESEFPLKGNFAILSKLDRLTDSVFIVGDINFPRTSEWTREEGAIVGTVTGNSKTNIDGYNVVIVPTVYRGEVIEPNGELFREFFE